MQSSHIAMDRDGDQAALRCAAAGDAALCTIVGIDGSFSRRLGAQLAIRCDGGVVGSMADGCLEGELARQAASGGEPHVIRYGRGSPIIDFRLPCGSGLDILVDPRPDVDALRGVVAQLDRREPALLALPASSPLAERAYRPSPRLVLCGSGPEAEDLAALAATFGLATEWLKPSRDLSLGRVPDGLALDAWSALVVLFHDHEWETALLDHALRSPAFFIGAQGGAETRAARLGALAALGHDGAALARLRSPIGLIAHSRDARVLALSVLADVIGAYEALAR